METILKVVKQIEEGEACVLPIRMIYKIPVTVVVMTGSRDCLFLRIESSRFTAVGGDEEGLCLFGKEIKGTDIKDKVIKIVNILRDIQFNKQYGHFIVPDPTVDMGWDKAWIELIGSTDHIKYNIMIDECCVCREFTKTKTPCNHSLCIECALKIPSTDDDGDDIEIPCPMCRQCIRHNWCEYE